MASLWAQVKSEEKYEIKERQTRGVERPCDLNRRKFRVVLLEGWNAVDVSPVQQLDETR